MNNPKPFHLTITNNQTGEVLHDVDVDALIGAAHTGRGVDVFGVNSCDAVALAATLCGAGDVVDRQFKKYPELYPLSMMVKAEMIAEEIKKEEENPTEGGEHETR